jgi:hypothetical protein
MYKTIPDIQKDTNLSGNEYITINQMLPKAMNPLRFLIGNLIFVVSTASAAAAPHPYSAAYEASGDHPRDTAFISYAQKQTNEMFIIGSGSDTAKYRRLMNEFKARYDRLDSSDQAYNKGWWVNIYYNFCCMYARKNIKGPALDLLDQSAQVGLNDYANLLVDSDMTNLRSEPRFQKVLMQIRSQWDYMYILGRAGAYDSTQQTSFPAFTYAPATDSNLVALRKAFNLDSIAGKGNESSQVINILQWIHYLIPHDGNHDNPVVKNAMSMIAQCKREDRGLNCRGLATVLNECYLAMGFTSRFVTCLPKDSLHIDNDCHVINLVYLPSLKKWVWMDPTFDAYVMNERGQLLTGSQGQAGEPPTPYCQSGSKLEQKKF